MINNDWDEVLSSVWNSPGFKKFMSIIDKKYSETTCFQNIMTYLMHLNLLHIVK